MDAFTAEPIWLPDTPETTSTNDRLRENWEARCTIDREARELLGRLEWAAAGCLIDRMLLRDEAARLICRMGWAVDTLSGVIAAANEAAIRAEERGAHQRAVLWRLHALTGGAGGRAQEDPAEAARDVVSRILNAEDDTPNRPITDGELRLARVDGLLLEVEVDCPEDEA